MMEKPTYKALWETVAQLQDPQEAERFLMDLCTPSELASMTERWQIAGLLDEGKMSYREIARHIGASTTTVARVARFLREEPHKGYRMMLDRQGAAKGGESV